MKNISLLLLHCLFDIALRKGIKLERGSEELSSKLFESEDARDYLLQTEIMLRVKRIEKQLVEEE